jgi:23S rRNA (guanosine2251-2'-O)-methyltransferase
LQTPDVSVAKVLISQRAQGAPVDAIVQAAQADAVPVERVKDEMVTAVARNGRHHQGVVADVAAAGLELLDEFLERRAHGRGYRASVLLLDGVHNPANVGVVIRSALAAGLDGVVVPRRGTADLSVPGHQGIRGHGVPGSALALRHRGRGCGPPAGRPLHARWPGPKPGRCRVAIRCRALRTGGLRARQRGRGDLAAVGAQIERWLGIPLGEDVESLNVGMAATLVAYEI